MKYLSEQLVKENEDYLTIPVIRKFAKNNKIKKLSDCDRPELLQELEEFADISQNNAEILQDWFENVLSEGIKTICLVKSSALKEHYNKNKVLNLYNELLINHQNNYINTIAADKFLSIYRLVSYNSVIGEIARLSLTKKVSYLKDVNDNLQTIKIPIQILFLLDHDIILIQFKSKSGIYSYVERREDLDVRITDDKLANECITYIKDILKLNVENNELNKNTLYNLLIKFTNTPKVIKDKINGIKTQLDDITNTICDDLCNVSESNKTDILWDLSNIVEKYISINVEDKTIFTEDRDAYPVKLISSDEEDSRVEQCSANVEPLQTKSIFFDNKKMMQKSKQCDGILLKYHRIDNMYFNNDIDVHIQVKNKYMVVKFTRYTMQEDIENVLNSIITSESRDRTIR